MDAVIAMAIVAMLGAGAIAAVARGAAAEQRHLRQLQLTEFATSVLAEYQALRPELPYSGTIGHGWSFRVTAAPYVPRERTGLDQIAQYRLLTIRTWRDSDPGSTAEYTVIDVSRRR